MDFPASSSIQTAFSVCFFHLINYRLTLQNVIIITLLNLLKSTVASAVFVVCCLENKCSTACYLGDQKDRVNRDILRINIWSAQAKKQYMQKCKKKFETLTCEF